MQIDESKFKKRKYNRGHYVERAKFFVSLNKNQIDEFLLFLLKKEKKHLKKY